MGSPYIGEIRMFAGNFAPLDWHICDGSLIPISENPTLYNLLGTMYGGDGVQTFGLPDLRSRVPIHQGVSRQGVQYLIGQMAGTEQVTLLTPNLPSHSHQLQSSTTNATASAANNLPGAAVATGNNANTYVFGALTQIHGTTLHSSSIGLNGGNQPHSNLQPYLAVSFIIALSGIYPSQS